jgi:hypothetical protein
VKDLGPSSAAVDMNAPRYINTRMSMFHKCRSESLGTGKEREKTDSATRKTFACQEPGTSAMRSRGNGKRIVWSWRVRLRACWLRKHVTQNMRRAWHKSTFDAPKRKTVSRLLQRTTFGSPQELVPSSGGDIRARTVERLSCYARSMRQSGHTLP